MLTAMQAPMVHPTLPSKAHEKADALSMESKSGMDSEELAQDSLNSNSFLYRDYSHVPPDEEDKKVNTPRFTPVTPPSILRIQKLPTKLDVILTNPEFSHIITWMPHGRSWKVLQPKLFLEQVIPLYFEYSNYNSFIRLVNAWGFRRMSKGNDKNSYYHELFLRGMPHLHKRMKRLTAKEKKIPINPNHEPDLHAVSSLHPLPIRNFVASGASAELILPARDTAGKKAKGSQHKQCVNKAVPLAGPLMSAQKPRSQSSQSRETEPLSALSEAVDLLQRQQKQEELGQKVAELESLQKKIADLKASIASQRMTLKGEEGKNCAATATTPAPSQGHAPATVVLGSSSTIEEVGAMTEQHASQTQQLKEPHTVDNSGKHHMPQHLSVLPSSVIQQHEKELLRSFPDNKMVHGFGGQMQQFPIPANHFRPQASLVAPHEVDAQTQELYQTLQSQQVQPPAQQLLQSLVTQPQQLSINAQQAAGSLLLAAGLNLLGASGNPTAVSMGSMATPNLGGSLYPGANPNSSQAVSQHVAQSLSKVLQQQQGKHEQR